jgi:signal transduction histidine kinase
MQQVILNLLTNARDAMPDGGRIYIKTSQAKPLFSHEEKVVELRVEDTGPGIAPENIDKIFDPFFTTKPEGEGTGLGLSVCQGIVEAHGGIIWAENAPSGGAAFVVRMTVDEG